MRSTTTCVLAALACLLVCAACEKEDKGKGTDEPCETLDECRGIQPSCVDLGDGVDRCESMCLEDADCGPGSDCIFAEGEVPGEGETPGVCWRRCEDAEEDCATGIWSCEPIIADDEQGYCVLLLD